MATAKPLLTAQLSKSGYVPPHYIRPISDRPTLLAADPSNPSIPLIDFEGFDGPDRPKVIKEIGLACQTDGFFQLKNHGIPKSVIEDMVCVAREFFKLPESERLKNYSDDPTKSTRLSTSFNIKKEKVSNWRDYLRLHCYPLEDFVPEWPSNPPAFKDSVSKYSTRARNLVLKLLQAISESLGLDKDYIAKALGKQGQHMAINYYPQCPQPELTYGLPGHTDPNALTVLLQDEVPDWPKVIEEMGLACQTDGFLQLKNHGIPKSVIEDMEWVPFYDFFNTKDTEKEMQDNGSSSTPNLLGFVLIRSGIGENLELDLLGQLKHWLNNHPQQEEEEEDHHNPPVWDIVKRLTRSDVGQLCRLVLHRDHIETFFPKWDPVKVERIADEGMRVQVLIKDVDTKFSSHWVVFRRWKSNRLNVFQSGWSREFVVRRKLKEGDAIGLCWDSKQSCFLFSVLKRA